MAKKSAGIVAYRVRDGVPEFLLIHPGGPLWVKKDLGAWSIPKGEFEDPEDPLEAARREFFEETGLQVNGNLTPLQPARMASGKAIVAFAIERDFDLSALRSNMFTMEWPPKSGKIRQFPEVDKAEWFGFAQASVKINAHQLPLLEEVIKKMKK